MFLGQGDTSKLEDTEQMTLAHLRRMIETGHLIALNPKESEVAIRAITFYGRWESAISVIQSMRNILILVAGGIAFWWATGGANFVVDFIRNAARAGQ